MSFFEKLFKPSAEGEVGQAEGRAGEQTWAELVGEQRIASPELTPEGMVEPTPEIVESVEMRGYEGNGRYGVPEVLDQRSPERDAERANEVAEMRVAFTALQQEAEADALREKILKGQSEDSGDEREVA